MKEIKIVLDDPKSGNSVDSKLIDALQKTMSSQVDMLKSEIKGLHAVVAKVAAPKPIAAAPAPVVNVTVANAEKKERSSDLAGMVAKQMKQATKEIVKSMPKSSTRTVVKEVTPDLSPITKAIARAMRSGRGADVPSDTTGTPYVKNTTSGVAG